MASKKTTRAVLRNLLGFDTETMNYSVFRGMLDDGVCPTQFPELGIEDCRPKKPGEDRFDGCVLCWKVALYDRTMDEGAWG